MIVKIFVVTKNEYDLIEDWVNFYGKIFGFENLTIIDTGSDNQIVLDYYEIIKQEGLVNLIIDVGYANSSQGDKFTKYMLLEKEKKSCDFLLGCDTDNFLYIQGKEEIRKEDYFDFFQNLPKNKNKFLIHKSLDSVIKKDKNYISNKYKCPTKCCNFRKGASVCINFYRTRSFKKTFNGNHQGITDPDEDPILTTLGMYHFNNTGIARLEERCLNICEGYKYFNLDKDDTFESSWSNLKVFEESRYKFHIGIHRVIQSYSFILRRFVLKLFNKYCDDSFLNLNNFYKVLYSSKNILDNIDETNYDMNFKEEYLNACAGNTSFMDERIKYTSDMMEEDFRLFFNGEKNSKIKITLEQVWEKDEIFKNDTSVFEDKKLINFLNL